MNFKEGEVLYFDKPYRWTSFALVNIPVILGNGIPLFPNQPKESTWKFAGSEAYDSGIVKITYVIG